MTAIVSATDVTRRYGEGPAAVDALAGVTVAFPRGEFAAVMGPSGSGKSTLMHVLAGLDTPTSGSVVIDGVELSGLDDSRLTALRRDKIGFVFQAFNLLPVLTAEENIVLPLSIAGRRPDREWLETLINAVGLADRVAAADLVVTGEGAFDWQSLHGKVVAAVAEVALARAVPVVVVAGQVAVGRREWAAAGISAAYAVAERPDQVPGAMADPAGTLAARAERVARTWSPPPAG